MSPHLSRARFFAAIVSLVVLTLSLSSVQLIGSPGCIGSGCTTATYLHFEGGTTSPPLAEPIAGANTYSADYHLSPDEFLALSSIVSSAPPLDSGARRAFLTLTGPLSDIEVGDDLNYLNVSGDATVSLVETRSVDSRLTGVLGLRALQVDIDPGKGVILYHSLTNNILELVKGKRVLPGATVAPVDGGVTAQLALLIGSSSGGGGGCPLIVVETSDSRYALSTSRPWPLLLPVEPGKVSVAFRETGTSVTTLKDMMALLLTPPGGNIVAVELDNKGNPVNIAYIDPSSIVTPPGALAIGAPVYPLLPGSTVTQAFKISANAGWYVVVSLRDPYGRSFYGNLDSSLRVARAILDLAPGPSGRRGVPLPKGAVEVTISAGSASYSFNLTSPSPMDTTILVPVPSSSGPANVSVSVANRGLVSLGVDYIGIVPGAAVTRQLARAEPLPVVRHTQTPVVLRGSDAEARFEVNVPRRGLLVLWPNLSVEPLSNISQEDIVYLPAVNLTASPSAALSATLPTQAILIPEDAEYVGLMVVLLNTNSTSTSRVLVDRIVLYYKPEIVSHDGQISIWEDCPDIPNAGHTQAVLSKNVTCDWDNYYEATYTSTVIIATYGASVDYQNVITPITYSNALIVASQVIVSSVENSTWNFDPVWETALGIDEYNGAYVVDEWIVVNDFNNENVTPLPANETQGSVGGVVDTAPLMLSATSLLLDTASLIVMIAAPEAGLATAVLGALSVGSSLGGILVSQLETPEPSPLGSHDIAFRRVYYYSSSGGSAGSNGVANASMSVVLEVGASNQAGEGAMVRLTFYLPPGPKFYEDFDCTLPICNCYIEPATLENITVDITISPVRYPYSNP